MGQDKCSCRAVVICFTREKERFNCLKLKGVNDPRSEVGDEKQGDHLASRLFVTEFQLRSEATIEGVDDEDTLKDDCQDGENE